MSDQVVSISAYKHVIPVETEQAKGQEMWKNSGWL